MMKFKINEIQSGKTAESLELAEGSLDLEPHPFRGGNLDVEFERFPNLIRVKFTIQTNIELICDRSLDAYSAPVSSTHEILFDANVSERQEEETYTISPLPAASNLIDIEEEVRETILLNIPVKKLHPRFSEGDQADELLEQSFPAETVSDPRWETLKSLKNDITDTKENE